MAGYSKFFVVGGSGGFEGSDGVNPIEFLILIGDADRQWLASHYFDKSIEPIGRIGTIVPAGPDHPDSLIDACIAFCPRYFSSCPSLAEVATALRCAETLDFDTQSKDIPSAWAKLREEARPLFNSMNIWQTDLVPLRRKSKGRP